MLPHEETNIQIAQADTARASAKNTGTEKRATAQCERSVWSIVPSSARCVVFRVTSHCA